MKIYVDHPNLARTWPTIDASGRGIEWDRLPTELLNQLARLDQHRNKQIVYCGTDVYWSYFQDDYYDLALRLQSGREPQLRLPFMEHKKRRIRQALLQELPADTPDRDKVIDNRVDEAIVKEIGLWKTKNAAEEDFLMNVLNRKFGYMTFPFPKPTPTPIQYANYNWDGIPIASEKGLDVQLSANLIADAVFNVYDVAVLLTNDADFIPAARFVKEELNKNIVQVGSAKHSQAIRKYCEIFIDLETVQQALAKDVPSP